MTNRLLENVTESQTTTVDCATTAPSPEGEKRQIHIHIKVYYIFEYKLYLVFKNNIADNQMIYQSKLDIQKC